jgi:non-homologous end joining protein Ku
MRPTWNGHVSFGLISIPVSLYATTAPGRSAAHHRGVA